MTEQLDWHRKDDLTQATKCGRYEVKRELSYANHPAASYDYKPKCLADPDRVIGAGAGTYTDSKFARQACQDDLEQLQRDAATTTKG